MTLFQKTWYQIKKRVDYKLCQMCMMTATAVRINRFWLREIFPLIWTFQTNQNNYKCMNTETKFNKSILKEPV